ncbi:ABC transporter permease [Flaviaesturariibacter amylovorans]|uniref:ABC transporter permease n=1 Tax=Flaviaesturariibacter amylovorans TaxID=1084520 RepID=A0ABP8GJ75_9BACT
MLRNYLKIAWRNLMRHKLTSGINLFGLAVGLTCCLLIGLYITHELSYDRQHPQAKNTYRLERTFLNFNDGSVSLQLSAVAPPFAGLVQNDFPEVKTITRLLPNGQTAFRFGEKMFYEPNVYFADEHLPKVFDFTLLRGNPAKALQDPFSVVLSEEVAKKYFGDTDPLNQLVQLDNNLPCKVTGVYKAFAPNTHLHPAALISFNTLRDSSIYGEQNLRTNFGNNAFFTYLVLPAGYDPARLQAQFPAFQDRHLPSDDNGSIKPSKYSRLSLRALTDIHLHSHLDDEAEPNGDIKRVYIFSVIALFILLIACINYMNLSTARSLLRAREIGVRKVIGAQRKELIAQFLMESVLITLLATVIAVAATVLLLPWINRTAGTDLSVTTLLRPAFLLPLLLVPFIVGGLAGIYPALFLSNFQPIQVLKGFLRVGSGSLSLRKALVVLQFSVSIILIIATAVVFRQLSYLQQKNLGYDREQVVTLFNNSGLDGRFAAFRNDLMASRNITGVARSTRIPTGRLLDSRGSMLRSGDSLAPTGADIKYVLADEDFIPVYNMQMAAGRNFDRARGSDSTGFVLNEAATRVLGVKRPADIVGQVFQYGGVQGTVIGVMRDFHFESLHQRIIPLVLAKAPPGNGYGRLSIKVSGDVRAALAHLESTWKKYLPQAPFDYSFLDASYAALYASEQRQAKLFTTFAAVALFIACLGLLGLSVFAISQRIKEIGIRKVLGADAGSIVFLLSRDFLRPVLLATCISFPVAWFVMSRWLQDFAYRIDMPWWVFLVAGAVAALVAFCTVSLQALRAASANPVKNLRTE